MRARMAIVASGVKVALREILLRDKPQEMLGASPKGTVPVLIDGESVIDESLAVMRWALKQNDPEGWLENDAGGLIEECDGPFKHHLDRYKYAARYEDTDPVQHRELAMAFVNKLEARLEGRSYLCGDQRRLADIATFPFIRQFRIADENWFDAAPIPNVQRWLKGLTASPLFQSVMEKYPLWKETGAEFRLAGAGKS